MLGQEAGLHVLLRLQTDLPDEVLEQEMRQAGIAAMALSRCSCRPTQSGTLVISCSELEAADLPRLLQTAEALCRP